MSIYPLSPKMQDAGRELQKIVDELDWLVNKRTPDGYGRSVSPLPRPTTAHDGAYEAYMQLALKLLRACLGQEHSTFGERPTP